MSAARTLCVNSSRPEASVMAEAARVLCDGGLVAFPTETVYGLAADAGNPEAIDRLNRVKGRPPEKPYSIHLGDPEQLRQFVKDVPPLAQRLMRQFWPGPLTIVIPAGREGWLGFRLPNHPVARAFLRLCQRRTACWTPARRRWDASRPSCKSTVTAS
jgi:L-threonylcarbamoyladenylate synthase